VVNDAEVSVEQVAQTWHHGLIAKWWSEFNLDGPEIAYFRRFVEGGQPALDMACGTGRLLLPYLRAGLDVDGCDVSPDMIALCREAATRAGLSPRLFVQAMHELDLPRRYNTILVCGAFGLGSTRDQDLEALRRFHEHLEPGGSLVFDNDAPYANPDGWRNWLKEARASFPEEWAPSGARRRASDGSEYGLRSRIMELDPLNQSVILEMRAEMWREGELAVEETHTLHMHLYFRDELLLMLERAGFADIRVEGAYTGTPATADDDGWVFIATKRS
jgi:SAM-dependent methyltransferase